MMEKDVEKGDGGLARPTESHAAEHMGNRVSLARMSVAGPPPPPPPKENILRPMTSSTKRLSFSTTTSQRKIKYGTGKHAQTELSPQPTDDLDDPLNWPQWKKELNFFAILMTVGLVGGMKTAYVSVNSVLAVQFNVSYTAVASLTAVPLVISSFTGLFSLMASKIWGKRPVYLVSMVLIFIGAIWNMAAGGSFGQCMGARVFQGLGWGAFDTLVLGSIQDTYFEHERNTRITVYNILSVATTWGAPILGGLASQNAGQFTIQFAIINVFQILAIPLLVFGAPETAFDRWFSGSPAPTPGSSAPWVSVPPKPLSKPTIEDAKAYIRTMRPVSFSGTMDLRTILQAPRAFAAPTTIVLFVVTFLPYCSLWGLTESLSLLFFPMPWMLPASSLGGLMVAPFILVVLTIMGFALYRRRRPNCSPCDIVCTLVGGTVLAAAGVLAFGLKTFHVMSDVADVPSAMFATDGVGTQLSFPLISLLLGFFAAGASVLDMAIRPIIWRSTQFTSSNMNVCLRNVADMDAGVTCWRNLFAGIFVMTIPNAIVMWAGLKSTVVGLGVSQIIIGLAVCSVWWFYDDYVRGLDGKVMGLVDLSMLKRTGSFFDTD